MPDFFSSGFDSGKLKSQLKMSATRLDIDSNKKSALMKQTMRGVAELLAESPPKEDIARVRTEALIRDDNMLLAYEILKMECQMLTERVSAIASSTGDECPPHLASMISDLIYAAPKISIPELTNVRKQFRKKFGRSFKVRAMKNENGILNNRIVQYMSLEPLTIQTVNLYMQKICKQYEVDWIPTIELALDDVIVLQPAVTGLAPHVTYENEHTYAMNPKFPNETHDMPLPVAPGYNKNLNDASSMTSKSSDDDDDNLSPSAPPSSYEGIVIMATPC